MDVYWIISSDQNFFKGDNLVDVVMETSQDAASFMILSEVLNLALFWIVTCKIYAMAKLEIS